MAKIGDEGIKPACMLQGRGARSHAYYVQDKCAAIDLASKKRRVLLRIAARRAARAGITFVRASSGDVLTEETVDPQFVLGIVADASGRATLAVPFPTPKASPLVLYSQAVHVSRSTANSAKLRGRKSTRS